MLDKLPAWARHLIILLAPGVLTFVSSTIVPGLQAKGGVYATLAGLVAFGVLYVTPWFTTQYGVGK